MEIRSSNIPFTQALTSHPSLPVHQNNPRPYFHAESSRLAASRPLQFAILVSLAITIAECFVAKTSPAPRHGLSEASHGAPPALAPHVVRQTASRSFLFYLIATTSTAYQPHPSSRRASPSESLFHKPPSCNANPPTRSYNARPPHGNTYVRPDWHCSSPEASCSHEGGDGERPNAIGGS